jgi:hypothetical protein
MRSGGMGPRPEHATQVRLALGPLMPSMFAPNCSALPKNAYIKTPPPSEAFSQGGDSET